MRGDWAITADHIAGKSGNAANGLLVTDGPGGDIMVEVRMGVVNPGAGIVLGYTDRLNYWTLSAVPEYATWNLTRTVAGVTTNAANTGLSSTANGTDLAVTLRSNGAVGVAINGQGRLLKVVPGLASSTRVGLAAGQDGAAVFREVRVTQPPASGP